MLDFVGGFLDEMDLSHYKTKEFKIDNRGSLFPDLVDFRRPYKGLCAYSWCSCKVYKTKNGDMYSKSKKHKNYFIKAK